MTTATITPATQLVLPHSHRWRIEEASGPTSEGRCACGAVKVFRNWLDVEIVRGWADINEAGGLMQ